MSREPPSIHARAFEASRFAVLVHGGAGAVREDLLPAHAEGCARAAAAGAEVLDSGGSALDAVERAVRVLEDDPCFNAGTGASLNEAGEIELDASIMCGHTLAAGAVCALPPFRDPIAIARRVLEDGAHVLLAGEHAARWAEGVGFTRARLEEMITEAARDKLARARALGERSAWAGGTVGAVARDHAGHVAAATSTGGTVNKRRGRVGDSPILGAGTYADDLLGACSCTGEGEAILRVGLARHALDLAARADTLEGALTAALEALFGRVGGLGGLIVARADGAVAFARNTRTMSWAVAQEGATVVSGW